ncbi:MAG: hypothetical protein ACC645_26190 [Pirellulales bacterium]
MSTRTFRLATLLITLAVTWPPAVAAVHAGCALGDTRHGHDSHADQCPHYHCKASIEEVKEKKTYFDVTCEPICIPRIHFPWEKWCEPKGARIKFVNVAKKVTYECKKCKTKFEPVCAEACDE